MKYLNEYKAKAGNTKNQLPLNTIVRLAMKKKVLEELSQDNKTQLINKLIEKYNNPSKPLTQKLLQNLINLKSDNMNINYLKKQKNSLEPENKTRKLSELIEEAKKQKKEKKENDGVWGFYN